MKRHSRNRLFVDPKVQGMLMLRCLAYWAAMLMTITVLLITWRSMSGPAKIFYEHFDELWMQYKLPFMATLFLLPLVMFDIAKLSNRFVGPMIRLRRALREMANGESSRLIHFRAGDYWSEVADEFNSVAARVQMMEKKIAKLEAELHGTAAAPAELTNEDNANEPTPRDFKPELKLVAI
jgi:hypothetical protein